MDNDDMSNKEMDRAVELAMEDEKYAIANRNNNSYQYVATRFIELHVLGYRSLEDPLGQTIFRALPANRYKKLGHWDFEPGPDNRGIIAPLEDVKSMTTRQCHLEINGLNGVMISRIMEQ